MRSSLSALILLPILLLGCKRQEAPSTSRDGDPPRTEGDEFISSLLLNHENFFTFLDKDSASNAFDELLGDVCNDLQVKTASHTGSGTWLNGVQINIEGDGLLSLYGELDQPASVSILRHRMDVPEVTMSKPVIWSSIEIGGKEYIRSSYRNLYIQGSRNGITEMTISFGVHASPSSKAEIVRKYPDCFEYRLQGFYSFMHGVDGIGGTSGAVALGAVSLYHYDTSDRIKNYNLGLGRARAELLSRETLNDSEVELSELSRRHLLQIMDMVTTFGIDRPENTVYKELLKGDALELAK